MKYALANMWSILRLKNGYESWSSLFKCYKKVFIRKMLLTAKINTSQLWWKTKGASWNLLLFMTQRKSEYDLNFLPWALICLAANKQRWQIQSVEKVYNFRRRSEKWGKNTIGKKARNIMKWKKLRSTINIMMFHVKLTLTNRFVKSPTLEV